MLEALQQLPGGASPPFRQIVLRKTVHYLWDDDLDVVHQIPQAEGGQQGNPLMPLLFALGQAAHLSLPHEILMAFLGDLFASSPLRVGHSFAVLQKQLLRPPPPLPPQDPPPSPRPEAAGVSHDNQRAQTWTFEGLGASNTKIQREDPQREKKE